MYDRILVAVDHSEWSDRAVGAARDLAVLSKGEVWVLHLREREMGAKTGVLRIDETTDDANAQVESSVKVLTEGRTREPAFVQKFPGSERPPTLAEVQEIQGRLTALGFNTDGSDGRVGRDTQRAVRDLHRAAFGSAKSAGRADSAAARGVKIERDAAPALRRQRRTK